MPVVGSKHHGASSIVAAFSAVLCCCLAVSVTAAALEEVPRVVARLAPQHCNPSIDKGSSAVPAATVAGIRALAAVTGLSYVGELAVPCWHVFNPAATLAATQAAVDVLKRPTAGLSVMSAGANAAAAAAAAGDGAAQLFTDAALEISRRLPQPTVSTPVAMQQPDQRQQQRRQATGQSSTAWQYLPPECDAATETCSNWGLTHSKTIDLWQDLGPLQFPTSNITRLGMVIDTGVEPRQFNIIPQLAINQSITISKDGNSPPDGQLGLPHGTHVFGIMAAGHGPFREQNDPSGTAGILGPAAQALAACNCYGRHGEARDGDVVACMMHAVATGTHWVINLSLGEEGVRNDTAHKLYYDALTQVCGAGGIAVMAAGNGVCVGAGCDPRQNGPITYVGVDMSNAGLQPDGVSVKPDVAAYPAVMAEYFPDCVIAVANIDIAGQLVSTSNFGAAVRIAAPGTDIVSTWPMFNSNNPWQTQGISGTSMASPHVAGAALLLRNTFPDATSTQVVRCLISSSSQPPAGLTETGRLLGGGMLNVRAAYDCLALELGQQPLFNCRVQDVPPCVDASSGVRDDACSEPFVCLTFNTTGSAMQPPANSSTGGNSTVSGGATRRDSSATLCDAPTVCGPNTACEVSEQGNNCSCLPGYLPPETGPIDGVGCSDPSNTTGNSTDCAAAGTCGPNTNCIVTEAGTVCSCLPGYDPPQSGPIEGSGCTESSNVTDCTAANVCGPNSSCNMTDAAPVCICSPGFSPPATGTIQQLGCVKADTITCRYKYRAAGSNCTLEGGSQGVCIGNATSCGVKPPQFCRRPQLLLNGTQFLASQNCSARVAGGSSCSATCIPGRRGQGYNVTCLLNGNWSAPVGAGCRELPVDTTVCGACRVGKICGDADGCTCIKKGGSSGRCQCAASLGFKEQAAVQAGVLTSRCVWDVRFPWIAASSAKNASNAVYYLVAPVNKMVVLQFTVGSGSTQSGPKQLGQICPASNVISSVQWIGSELPRCPSAANTIPIRLAQSTSAPGEVCNKVLVKSYYTFDTSKLAAKRGACFLLRVTTTDGLSYVVRVLLS